MHMGNPKREAGEFPGGPVIRTPSFHCQGPGFELRRSPKVCDSTRNRNKNKTNKTTTTTKNRRGQCFTNTKDEVAMRQFALAGEKLLYYELNEILLSPLRHAKACTKVHI